VKLAAKRHAGHRHSGELYRAGVVVLVLDGCDPEDQAEDALACFLAAEQDYGDGERDNAVMGSGWRLCLSAPL
jgi:hypothetical protein